MNIDKNTDVGCQENQKHWESLINLCLGKETDQISFTLQCEDKVLRSGQKVYIETREFIIISMFVASCRGNCPSWIHYFNFDNELHAFANENLKCFTLHEQAKFWAEMPSEYAQLDDVGEIPF